jgi:hypothetical protein
MINQMSSLESLITFEPVLVLVIGFISFAEILIIFSSFIADTTKPVRVINCIHRLEHITNHHLTNIPDFLSSMLHPCRAFCFRKWCKCISYLNTYCIKFCTWGEFFFVQGIVFDRLVPVFYVSLSRFIAGLCPEKFRLLVHTFFTDGEIRIVYLQTWERIERIRSAGTTDLAAALFIFITDPANVLPTDVVNFFNDRAPQFVKMSVGLYTLWP